MNTTIRIAAVACIMLGGMTAATAQDLAGRYRGPTGTVTIAPQAGGSYAVSVEATNSRGSCGVFSGRGAARGQQIVATEGQGADVCRLTVSSSGDMIRISSSGGGCLLLHGASCPGFDGSYRRIGRAARAEPPGPETTARSTPPPQAGQAAPYGDWVFLENGRCFDSSPQGVRISRDRIIVNYMDTTNYSNVTLAGCDGGVCTFRQRGSRAVWTTRWTGANQIAFRGPHGEASENNRATSKRSIAVRAGSLPGCAIRF